MKALELSYTPLPVFPWGMPCVNVRLLARERVISVSALVDSGSALNILPFDTGLELGFSWDEQTFPLDLTGTLRGSQAFAVATQAEIKPFPPLELAFAWVKKPDTKLRVLLGQVNFFQEFDVRFFGHRRAFDIIPRRH